MSEETRRFRKRARNRTAAALTALAALILAGCGSAASTPTVASLPGHGSSSGSNRAGLTEAQSDADMVRFTRCMRAHGVQMSDPFHRPGNTGLTLDLPVQDAATAFAYHACNAIIAPIVQQKVGHMTAVAAPRLAALTRWAECMRAHDIDMLDPTLEGVLSLGTVPGITDSFGRYSPQFRAADTACRHLLPAGVHDDGSGP